MRVYLHTFGCKANQYDTEFVRQSLEAVGAETVDSVEMADVAIVNSCTVTHVGEAKMRGLVRRVARQNPDIKTVVMGCAAALDDGTIANLPGVSGVVGGSDAEAVMNALGLQAPQDPILHSFGKGSRAWLKIQDGCDEHCTFCATTLARGAHRSRAPDEVVTEAAALADCHSEIVVTGVHIGSYGQEWDGMSLGTILHRLVREVPGVRFRLSSVEATEVDEKLIELMQGEPHRLAPHLHAPLQSGNDQILKKMGRHWYTAASYRERCEEIAIGLPAFGLGADIIVGFPGETDSDFQDTMHVVRDLPFTYLHVFPYSERPGAAAQRIGPPTDPSVVAARSAELREHIVERTAWYKSKRSGDIADVVTLGRRGGKCRGLTEDYLDVYLSTDRQVAPRFEGRLEWNTEGSLMCNHPS